MVVNVTDQKRNTWNFYFNEGVQVLGNSLNPPLTYQLYNKHSRAQTEDIFLTLIQIDIGYDVWIDKYGIAYQKIDDSFEIITAKKPYSCNDTPLSETNVPTRSNCNFRALTVLWS